MGTPVTSFVFLFIHSCRLNGFYTRKLRKRMNWGLSSVPYGRLNVSRFAVTHLNGVTSITGELLIIE